MWRLYIEARDSLRRILAPAIAPSDFIRNGKRILKNLSRHASTEVKQMSVLMKSLHEM
jgi:hypothetical protein